MIVESDRDTVNGKASIYLLFAGVVGSLAWVAVTSSRSYRLPQIGRNTKQQLEMSSRISPCPACEAPMNVREIHTGVPKNVIATCKVQMQPYGRTCG